MISTEPVLLGDDHSLFGILNCPSEPRFDTGVIILNAGLLHNVGPFRLHVDLGHALSEAGIPTLRIDQSGKGESPARQGMTRHESVVADYDDALARLARHGVKRAILVGLCSGADDSTVIAEQRDSVSGIVLLDGYAKRNLKFKTVKFLGRLQSVDKWAYYIKKILSRVTGSKNGASKEAALDNAGINIRDWPDHGDMRDRFKSILENKAALLAVFSSGQDYYNYIGQFCDSVGLGTFSDQIEEEFFTLADHTYSNPDQRENLESLICKWIEERCSDSNGTANGN